MPVYLVLQPIRRAAHNIPITPGGLLPRLFTLTSASEGGYFLSRYSTVADSSQLKSVVLYVARTFLSFLYM